MKQFEDEFSRKAKEAFESYDADHLAGDGWNSYLDKYGKGRRRVFIIPFWARAASILILLSMGLLITNRSDRRNAGDQVNQVAQETRSSVKESPWAEQKSDSTEQKSTLAGQIPNVSEQKSTVSGQKSTLTGQKSTEEKAVIAVTGEAHEAAVSATGQTRIADANKAVPDFPDLEVASEADAVSRADMTAAMSLPANPSDIRLIDDGTQVLKLTGLEMQPILSEIPREKRTTVIMTGLSGMMASIENSASTARGVSAGFYVEQQLTRRISVRPGLAMAKHNYSMANGSEGTEVFNYAAPQLDGLSGTTTSYEADMEILSMEVPVNFVFSLRKRAGSDIFVTTGASTVIYLNQRLSGSFNNTYTRPMADAATGEVKYESMTTSVKIERDQELLSRVDFLGLANFSAGYSLPFGRSGHLLFEPFVQLPVKDITSLNLRIRYGGLSMKIQF